jgi:hypothetical protein
MLVVAPIYKIAHTRGCWMKEELTVKVGSSAATELGDSASSAQTPLARAAAAQAMVA